jgi:hypothetical protein
VEDLSKNNLKVFRKFPIEDDKMNENFKLFCSPKIKERKKERKKERRRGNGTYYLLKISFHCLSQ